MERKQDGFVPLGDVKRPLHLTWRQLYRQFGVDPAKAGNRRTVDNFRTDCLRELKKSRTPGQTCTTRRSRGAAALPLAAGDRAVTIAARGIANTMMKTLKLHRYRGAWPDHLA